MNHVEKCTSVLRPLILQGESSGIPLAENALNELVEVTPGVEHKNALHDVRAVIQAHRETACQFHQLGFADTVNDYIEKLMRALE